MPSLRISDQEEAEFDKGFVFERCPEVLVKGHFALVSSRDEKMAACGAFSKYLFSPMKYNFKKTILITAVMFKHLKARILKMENSLKCQNKYKFFAVRVDQAGNDVKSESLTDFFAHGSFYGTQVKMFKISDDDTSQIF